MGLSFLKMTSTLWYILASEIIVIPGFAAAAVEHWRLITYKKTSILYQEINVFNNKYEMKKKCACFLLMMC